MKTHRYFQVAVISFALVFASSAPAFCQSPQNNPPSPSQIQIVKDQIQKIGVGEDVTVMLASGLEYYGAISKIGPDSFEIAETDLKQMVTIAYADVLNVNGGYGAMSSTGKGVKPPNVKPPSSRGIWIFVIASIGVTVGFAVWVFKKMGKRQTSSAPFPRFP